MNDTPSAPPWVHTHAIRDIGQVAAIARRADLLAGLIAQHGPTVQAGPFAGMVLPGPPSSSDGNLLPRLLGCYESELNDPIAVMLERQPDMVVCLGIAEGYYPVGFARVLLEAHVHGFDASDAAQEICRDAARLNNVDQRVSVGGQCSQMVLQHLLVRARRPLVLCDIEGDERLLIDPARVPALAGCMLIVECHDYLDAKITQTLAERLSPTHELSAAREGGRDPNAIGFLQGLDSLDRWLSVCEFRPCTMHWLIGLPKRSGGG